MKQNVFGAQFAYWNDRFENLGRKRRAFIVRGPWGKACNYLSSIRNKNEDVAITCRYKDNFTHQESVKKSKLYSDQANQKQNRLVNWLYADYAAPYAQQFCGFCAFSKKHNDDLLSIRNMLQWLILITMYERSDAYVQTTVQIEILPQSDNLQLAGNCRMTLKIYTDGPNKHFPWPTDVLTSIYLEYILLKTFK